VADYEREMGEIHTMLIHLNQSIARLSDRVEALCDHYDARVGALERWRSWVNGAGMILGVAWGMLLALWKRPS